MRNCKLTLAASLFSHYSRWISSSTIGSIDKLGVDWQLKVRAGNSGNSRFSGTNCTNY